MAHVIDLSGKTALVTGAGHGIGASIARTMAGAGAKTVVNYRKSEGKARAVVDSIKQAGGDAIALQADVTDGAQVDRMREEILKAYRPVDILINNALDQKEWKPFLELPWEIFQSQV